MKTMKKMMVLVLSVLMVLGSTMVTSFAANEKITINNAKPGEKYELYKLFDLAVDNADDPSAYTYTVNSAWANFFATGGAGAQYVTINAAGAVTAISDAAALAKAAANWANKPNPTKTVTVAAGATTAEFSDLANGYWLITSTLGTIAMAETTPDKAAVTINEKNPEDSIKKEVKEDSTNTFGASNDAQVGDTVYFQSTVTLIPGTRNVKVHDTMTSGLTFNDDIAIEGLTAGTDYTLTPVTSGDTFTITFTDTYINGLTANTELVVTYSAKLNKNAINSTPGVANQTNTTTITYGDKQSKEATTTTTTHKFEVLKYAGTDKTKNLANAIFQLKKGDAVVKLYKIDANNYRVIDATEANSQAATHVGENNTVATVANGSVVSDFVTVGSGNIVIWGVDSDDDYKLTELQQPEGYNILTSDVAVTVKADNTTTAEVANEAGSELPSTGGMGTTILYIMGGALVVVCGIMLVAKKRTSNK